MQKILLILLTISITSCETTIPRDDGLQKSPCACNGVIYDSRMKV
jgi:hypothetical protein